jgi:hypothetical protein
MRAPAGALEIARYGLDPPITPLPHRFLDEKP